MAAGSTYSKDQGWEYAVLKFKNDMFTRIKHYRLIDSVSTSIYPKITTNACIVTPDEIKNIDILVNGSIQFHGSLQKNELLDNQCVFSLSEKLKLKEGKNSVKFIITDQRDFIVISNKIIHYIPPDNFLR